MNCSFLHSFYCNVGSLLTTFFAHTCARYLVGTSIFPRVKTKTPSFFQNLFGSQQTNYTHSYNYPIAALIYGWFFIFFLTIAPIVSVEQACAIMLFSFTIAVTIITDFYTYLISTFMTLYLIPAVFFYAHMGYLKISLSESIISALIVGAVMALINFLYKKRREKDAFGEGDRDLLMYVAAFLGWFSTLHIIFYGSLIGSVWGIIALARKQTSSLGSYVLPFGTCLGFGVFVRLIILYGNSSLAQLLP